MYKRNNNLDKYYKLKPTLNESQRDILNAYYKARREGESEKRVKANEFLPFTITLNYEPDVAIYMMQQLDDHYLSLIAERQKIEMERQKVH